MVQTCTYFKSPKHSLYTIILQEYQLSWRKLRREPSTRCFDQSFAPISVYDERFARQYRYNPSPEFPLSSPCIDIVHHLSGPNTCAITQNSTHYRLLVHTSPFFISNSHMVLKLYILAIVSGLLNPCFKTGCFNYFFT